jgi:hypothetical protein
MLFRGYYIRNIQDIIGLFLRSMERLAASPGFPFGEEIVMLNNADIILYYIAIVRELTDNNLNKREGVVVTP